jgi:hypothetical protein
VFAFYAKSLKQRMTVRPRSKSSKESAMQEPVRLIRSSCILSSNDFPTCHEADHFYRLSGGQFVEEHGQPDMLGLLQQIGAVRCPFESAPVAERTHEVCLPR